jgi:hypothetical protein
VRFRGVSDHRGVRSQLTIDLPALSVRAAIGSVNEDKRTVEVIFSTGAAVLRYDYNQGRRYREVLSMDPKHVRLGRLNAGAPVLDSHSAWSVGDVLGVTESDTARIEKGRGIVTLRFSEREAVADIWGDVKGGIIRSVSIGYAVYKFQEDSTPKDGIPVRTAIDWEPFEVSMVPMPADAGARVRSADKALTNPCVILTRSDEDDDDADSTSRYRCLALEECAS